MVAFVVLKKVLNTLLIALLSEKVIIRLVLLFGDWLVDRTTNELDNKGWEVVKEELEKSLG